MKIDIEKIRREKPLAELLKFSIINLDKPSGPTSFSVSHYVKNLLGVNKTSHFGTLDPQVSGVLPIGISRACRLNDYFIAKDKTYVGIMRLHKEIKKEDLEKAISKFIGVIKQLPPVKSRVKRAIREREIKTFKILDMDGKDVLFETQVQAGTYIRKLCDDIGHEIGGAHMLELRRIQASIFNEKDSVNLYQLEEAFQDFKSGNDLELRKILIPAEIISTLYPVITIKKDVLKKCLAGSPIFQSFLSQNIQEGLKKGDKVMAFCEGRFVGCYNFLGLDDAVAKPEFVFN